MRSICSQLLIVLLSMLLMNELAYSDDIGSSTHSIKNGDPVPVTEFEAVGSLNGVCTATLIEPDLVLTAAHCVCPEDESREGCASQAIFTLRNIRPIDSPTTRRNINMTGSVSLHPKFATDSNWLSNDFAIVRLNQKATDIALVKPIPLELPTQRPKLGESLTIIGFGTGGSACITDPPIPQGKRKVTLPLHEISTGNVTLRIGTNTAGACLGDSGGPALNAAGNIVGVASSLPGNYDPTDLAYNWIYPDTSTVKANSTHSFHFESRDQHQFNLVSVYPLTINGILRYEWDNVRDPGPSRFIRRLTVLNQSDFPVSFRHKVSPVSLAKVPHTVEMNETASVQANGKHGFHFEMQDRHQFYLESVYPTTVNGRITYEWDNVRDPGNSRFIRRLTVKNKSDFLVTFKLKVVKINLDPPPTITELIKTELMNKTASVQANGKHGSHFERQDRHQFYLESVYPTTVNGRITYRWDNVRDPGNSGFIRRLTVTNKSDFPVTFKLKVLGVTLRDEPVKVFP